MNAAKYTLLLVDDDAILLRGLERYFANQSYKILTAVSAAEAHAMLKRHCVDVIITDNNMPGMSGTEFLAKTRQEFPDVVCVILTGHASMSVALQAINEIGVYRLFTKPCRLRDIAEAIESALEERHVASSTTSQQL